MEEKNHWMIDVNEQENPWIIQVNNQVKEIEDISMEEIEKNRWQRRSIYKVPESVKNLKGKEKTYKPQVVSFGPYHYKDEKLAPMEEHKDRALLHFLKRTKKSVQSYYASLVDVVEELKEAYESLDHDLEKDSDEFLRIMIRDGVFMLEILKYSYNENNFGVYAPNDPVFSDHGKLYVMPLIRRDMLMLENQLPMLVLHKLLAVEKGLTKENEDFTNALVYRFFFPRTHSKPPSNCLHILDMYRKSLLQPTAQNPRNSPTPAAAAIADVRDDIIRSAIELTEAGITIKRARSRNITDITFHNGILKIPMIIVDDITETLFSNLVAFERFHVGAGNEVSWYVFFMDNIIDNAQDVGLLSSRKIIQNCIGSDKEAAKLFNSLAKDVMLDPECSIRMLCVDINGYCQKRWPRYRANLIQNYFRSPWALLSVIAAIVLFALTIQQSVYTTLDYHKPNM
ncbi:hypothetical protein M9H77_09079 [Catharanthus roseus]|uniref:Uncharacterized protein n=1 Tax=Catharanthus roseus TaxID=4058 RepID=A0ACC0BZT0_CATRO|nr:hypothetical protein M9H77_09079 [Catharanthus roseus]